MAVSSYSHCLDCFQSKFFSAPLPELNERDPGKPGPCSLPSQIATASQLQLNLSPGKPG